MLVKQLKNVTIISTIGKCSKVINGLPSCYNAFRTAWHSVAADKQTFENLTARLMKEESKMHNEDSESSRLALEVKTSQSKLEAASLKSKMIRRKIALVISARERDIR